MDRIVTCGRIRKIDGSYCLCDLKDQNGFTTDFPVHKGAFQEDVSVDAEIAFMTWETVLEPLPGHKTPRKRIHQSACKISAERYEELLKMSFADAERSMTGKEFLARSLVSP